MCVAKLPWDLTLLRALWHSAAYTANITQHRLSSKQVIAEAEYDRAYCAHDAAVGVSRTQLQRWASSL